MQDQTTRDLFLFGYRPQPGDTVVDVGAGVGSEVRLFSRLVGSGGHVLSIEAHPRIFQCLRRTVAENRLANVSLVQAAVVAEPGPVRLEDDLTAHVSNGLTDDPDSGVEGAELPALAGALDVLPRIDHLVVSCHDFKADRLGTDWQRTLAPVTALLHGAGYEVRTRPHDPRPWVRCYVYASRPGSHSADATRSGVTPMDAVTHSGCLDSLSDRSR